MPAMEFTRWREDGNIIASCCGAGAVKTKKALDQVNCGITLYPVTKARFNRIKSSLVPGANFKYDFIDLGDNVIVVKEYVRG